MKILFAQEFGRGLADPRRFVALADRLQAHHATLAIPDAAWASGAQNVEVRAAPTWRTPKRHARRADEDWTLADMFHRFGYADLGALTEAAEAWQALLDDVQPDLIVSAFSPTLRLISEGKTAMVVVGSGFASPPAGRELPLIKSWTSYRPAASIRREREVLAAANAVRKKNQGPVLEYFADLFQGDETFPVTWEGADPYQTLRQHSSIHPFDVPNLRPGPPITARSGPPIFAYLDGAAPNLNVVATALNRMPARTQLYVLDADPVEVARQVASHMAVSRIPVDFWTVLRQASLFVHHGGASSAYAGLLAGVPQFVIANRPEQQVTAYGVHAKGCGVGAAISAAGDATALSSMFGTMLVDRALQSTARQVGKTLAAERRLDSIRPVVEACTRLLGG